MNSFMIWYVGTWRVTGANSSKEDKVAQSGYSGKRRLLIVSEQTGECYLLIDCKWGIFGRRILGVHGCTTTITVFLTSWGNKQSLNKKFRIVFRVRLLRALDPSI